MGSRLGALVRLDVPARQLVTAWLTLLLLTALAGCGTEHSEQASQSSPSQEDSSGETAVIAANEASIPHPVASRRSGTVNVITLSNERCIRFEPQWTNVRIGQSITWRSELKSTMTIYVSPGVFARENFRVRPGATVSTGPALAEGRYSFWTEPSACREAPRGVLLAGPGVRVRETFYASSARPR